MSERRFDAGHLVGIQVGKDNTLQVTAIPAKGPDPKDAAAHRDRVEHMWFERFDKDHEQFVAARKLDTSRPTTKQPVQWQYVSFEEGLALAKKSGKPLFVDVLAFWCVWCYRMDYTTYPDQEVAQLLGEKFIPVKIIEEQDLAGDYEPVKKRLEASGIPAMGIFDAEGNLLHKISGWKKPEDFVQDLKKGLQQ